MQKLSVCQQAYLNAYYVPDTNLSTENSGKQKRCAFRSNKGCCYSVRLVYLVLVSVTSAITPTTITATMTWTLLCARQDFKCSIISLKQEVLLSVCYRWGNWGTDIK